MGIVYRADQWLPNQPGADKYLNTATVAHYTYESYKEDPSNGIQPNHAVCIVGYDDTYPKENFNADHQPQGDGAFIVKNSWGSITAEDDRDRGTFGSFITEGYF